MPACNICGCARFVDMPPNPASIFIRKKAQCDGCQSLERHRLLYELLETRGYLKGEKTVLHIAPEPGLGRALRDRFGVDYRAVDADPSRYPGLPVEKIDLCTDLGRFAPGSFDIVIHNHVIEHLACDYRQVLHALDGLVAPGGVHAFTVPFLEGGFRETFEPVDDAYRLRHFGQTDHVRVFSPSDAVATLGSAINIPDPYDATKLVAPARLRAIAVPESQWRGYNNNAVFFIEKPQRMALSPKRIGATHPAALFVSANGIGRGHLTRQLAIARRMTERRPVFLTMSYATGLVARAGFLAQFLPHHDLTGQDPSPWQDNLAREISMLIDATGADTLVYDVNFVFDGVIDVLRARPKLRSFWIRRAMWPEHHRAYMGAGIHFSRIIEPGDIAETFDQGPTVAERGRTERVAPVLLVDPADRLSRTAAREALSLPPDAVVVMVDLLSTAAHDYEALRARIIPLLLAGPDIVVVELKPVLGRNDQLSIAGRHRVVALDESFRYSLAWDGAVVRAGYNTFQEQMLGAVASIFVPNTARDMDRQDNRARFAEQNGCGAMLAVDAEQAAVETAVKKLLDGDWRGGVARACSAVAHLESRWENGAVSLARSIDAA